MFSDKYVRKGSVHDPVAEFRTELERQPKAAFFCCWFFFLTQVTCSVPCIDEEVKAVVNMAKACCAALQSRFAQYGSTEPQDSLFSTDMHSGMACLEYT